LAVKTFNDDWTVVIHKYAAHLDKKEQERLAALPKISPRGVSSTPRLRPSVAISSGGGAATIAGAPSSKKRSLVNSKEVKVINPLANPNKPTVPGRGEKFNIPRNASMPSIKYDQNATVDKQPSPPQQPQPSGGLAGSGMVAVPPLNLMPAPSALAGSGALSPHGGSGVSEASINQEKLAMLKSQSSRELKSTRPPPSTSIAAVATLTTSPQGVRASVPAPIAPHLLAATLQSTSHEKLPVDPSIPPSYFEASDYLPLADGDYSADVQNKMRKSLVSYSFFLLLFISFFSLYFLSLSIYLYFLAFPLFNFVLSKLT
jgi:hypothetical protein